MAIVTDYLYPTSRYEAPEVHSWGDDIHQEDDRPEVRSPYNMGHELSHLYKFAFAEKFRNIEEADKPSEFTAWHDWIDTPLDRYTALLHRGDTTKSAENLRQRLANANDYFRRKATEVFNDEAALGLLDAMYQDVVVDISTFNACENGLPLARLTAANFCEVGAKVIYITEAGQRFIDTLRAHE